MNALFTALGYLLFLQSIFALAGVLRFAHYSRRARLQRGNRYQPKAIVIVPCKGLEHDFEENIRALLAQDYRDYEVIFVTESPSDPAHGALARIVKQTRRASWMIHAGEAKNCGQKVHNLIAAIEMLDSVDRRAEVLVFADSDARVTREWLSELVAPLGDKRTGATTGFRWYVPVKGGAAALLQSVWNASALSLLGERSSFAWGGSMAIRREMFEKLEIKQRWRGAVSDDYVLSTAIHEAGQKITFVPQCLVASYSDATLDDLLEFSTRQIRITRVYAPRVWMLTSALHLLYNFTFWGGLLWVVAAGLAGISTTTVTNLLSGVFLVGAITGLIRAGVAMGLLASAGAQVRTRLWAYALLGPAASFLYLCNVIASMRTKRIVWRGISYDLISPRETVIFDRPDPRRSRTAAHSSKQKTGSVRSSSQKR
jgi:cellulose synthase/poly-beta-1,6-N-acetylglucosamine synthase-like glycosyltransferase